MDALAVGLGVVGLCLALWILHIVGEMDRAHREETDRLYRALEKSIR